MTKKRIYICVGIGFIILAFGLIQLSIILPSDTIELRMIKVVSIMAGLLGCFWIGIAYIIIGLSIDEKSCNHR